MPASQAGSTLAPSGRRGGRPPWSAVPVVQSVWSLESTELALQQFRVLSVVENPINGGEGLTYRITALKHVPGKLAAINDGTRLELPPISIIPPSGQPPRPTCSCPRIR